MAELKDLSTTDANNNGAASAAGFPEGMNPSDVNNAARALEGMIARHLADNNGTLNTTGSSNAYVLAANATVAAYTAGDTYLFKANHTNTGAATINVDGLGTKALQINGAAVSSGNIESGKFYQAIYDGTAFQLTRLSQVTGIADGAVTTAKIADDAVATAKIADDAVTPAKAAPALNRQTGSTYTFALSDNLKTVMGNSGSAQTFTIPTNASVAFGVDTTRIDIYMQGAGVISVTGDTGVTVNGVSAGSGDLAQYGACSLYKVATDTWLAVGLTVA